MQHLGTQSIKHREAVARDQRDEARDLAAFDVGSQGSVQRSAMRAIMSAPWIAG